MSGGVVAPVGGWSGVKFGVPGAWKRATKASAWDWVFPLHGDALNVHTLRDALQAFGEPAVHPGLVPAWVLRGWVGSREKATTWVPSLQDRRGVVLDMQRWLWNKRYINLGLYGSAYVGPFEAFVVEPTYGHREQVVRLAKGLSRRLGGVALVQTDRHGMYRVLLLPALTKSASTTT
jgi:hypothetical protein